MKRIIILLIILQISIVSASEVSSDTQYLYGYQNNQNIDTFNVLTSIDLPENLVCFKFDIIFDNSRLEIDTSFLAPADFLLSDSDSFDSYFIFYNMVSNSVFEITGARLRNRTDSKGISGSKTLISNLIFKAKEDTPSSNIYLSNFDFRDTSGNKISIKEDTVKIIVNPVNVSGTIAVEGGSDFSNVSIYVFKQSTNDTVLSDTADINGNFNFILGDDTYYIRAKAVNSISDTSSIFSVNKANFTSIIFSENLKYGDLNNDNRIDTSDLQILLQYYNTLPAGLSIADFDKNNIINASDLSILNYNFNKAGK